MNQETICYMDGKCSANKMESNPHIAAQSRYGQVKYVSATVFFIGALGPLVICFGPWETSTLHKRYLGQLE
jgi:hypothetical protein